VILQRLEAELDELWSFVGKKANRQGVWIALDGSEYFRSSKIQCPHGLRQLDSKGRVHYSHMIVGATVVRAGLHQVVPLDVEEVRNATAESTPQDSELMAGKRLIARLRREHPQMALIVIGDDLYAHVPFVEQL